ncbi:MAG: hypothetical protein IT281_03360 [Ignavibacteria bacterium]|nr:hypothetical protein [Ignavibacteria bacterium]
MMRPFLIAAIAVCSLIMFQSCSDNDSTTNPGSQAGTVLYSWDSVNVWLPAGTSASGTDSVNFSTSEAGSVKVEFTIQSNVDGIHAKARWGFYTNATPVVPYIPVINGPIDEPFSKNLSLAAGSTYFGFAVSLNIANSTEWYYVKLKNVKVTKQ